MLVVWHLNRLCRSLTHLIDLVRDVEAKGLGLGSLKEGIDTKAGEERSFFHFIGALSEFEQDAGRERGVDDRRQYPATAADRPGSIKDIKWIRITLMLDGDKSITRAAEDSGVSRQAIYSRLENEIQPTVFRQFKEALVNGEDRGEVLRRMNLSGPALKYLERQEAKKAKRKRERKAPPPEPEPKSPATPTSGGNPPQRPL